MRIFLTGADGFIGSHLTEKLIRSGFEVIALCQYNSFNNIGWLKDSNIINNKNLKIINGDIRDAKFIENHTKKSDIIVHLASLIGIPYSYHAPSSYVYTNIIGTLNILEAAKNNNVKKIIHTSTSEVYGTAKYVPIDENHPLVGQSPYSASKISADQLAYSFFCSFNLPLTILRPFNTYGPRQSERAIIPTIINQILQKPKFVELGNIDTARDFNFVSDTVEAFYKTIISNNSKIIGKTINIGSGYEIKIKDLYKLISDIMGHKLKIKTTKVRLRPAKSEVNRLLANNNLAKKLIKWKPKYYGRDGLKVGLTDTISWLSNKSENINKKSKFIY